jgi:L-threonylcarbamoyladenylate synthase
MMGAQHLTHFWHQLEERAKDRQPKRRVTQVGSMTSQKTEHLMADDDGIAQAATLLQNGALVAFATETVYGLGADARNGQAVAQVYAAKGRPSFNPLIVHVPDVAAAQKYVEWSDQAQQIADAFWPGALTLVLPLRKDHGLSSLVTAGLPTLAIRVPNHPTATALLRAADAPIAAPSANPSGQISPTTAAHVLAGLNGKIAAVLDDGPCTVGLESTILTLAPTPTLLRAGGVPAEDIEALLGHRLSQPTTDTITAPGQLASHYAPRAAVRLNADDSRKDELFLGFGPMHCDLNLSPSADLTEAAANLFDHLHHLDALGKPIAVAPIPMVGLGVAINDRLSRAAAPR